MEQCNSVVGLARELGIHWGLLYKWKRALRAAAAAAASDAAAMRESALQAEIAELKTALADKVLEVDFFRGALHRIAMRRPSRRGFGGQPFTTKSGR